LCGMQNMFTDKNSPPYRAPAVNRALSTLRLLASSPEPLGVSEIARALAIGKSSVYGILQTLLSEKAVEEVEGKKYRLGTLMVDLARSWRSGRSLAEVCDPYLVGLSEETGWTTIAAVPEKTKLRIEGVREVGGSFRVGAVPGMRVPLLAGAPGKVYLAWSGARVPEELPAFTAVSITDPRVMAREVEQARGAGLAFDRGEYLQGVASVAAPVFGSDQLLVAVLYAVGFMDQAGGGKLERIGFKVRQAAQRVGRELSI
jgi:DNA-binding IclR family transcriptional regulator